MIAFLRGVLAVQSQGAVVIDVNGVGYRVLVPESTLSIMPGIGQQVFLNTYLVVREDDMQLYGFKTEQELAMFSLLISVSGIGPKGGLAVLSLYPPEHVQQYIITENVTALTKVPGIGKKTAQRILLELKDKVKALPITMSEHVQPVAVVGDHNLIKDAENALMALGYGKGEAEKAVKQAINGGTEMEDLSQLIKLALKNLMKE